MSNPEPPAEIATLEGTPDHTFACVFECRWAYGSHGTIVGDATATQTSGYLGTALWPQRGRDRFVLGSEESSFSGTCDDNTAAPGSVRRRDLGTAPSDNIAARPLHVAIRRRAPVQERTRPSRLC